MVAVMKKFHGRRVARPMMKKMIHTALYLVERVEIEEVHKTDIFFSSTRSSMKCDFRPNETQLVTHLSRGALMAVMVPVTVGGTCLAG